MSPIPDSNSEIILLPIANLPPSHPPLSVSEISTNPRKFISLPAVPLPHAGTSYNPVVDAHTELLHQAHNQEEVRLREDVRWKDIGQAIKEAVSTEPSRGAEGMVIDIPGSDAMDEENAEDAPLPPQKNPQRKTKAARRKAAKALAEKRLLAERAAKRRQMTYLSELKSKQARRMGVQSAETMQQRKKALQDKLKTGLAGQRLGKHRVPETLVDVQLGDELSESLRGIKVRCFRMLLLRVFTLSLRLRETSSKIASLIYNSEH